MLWFLIGFAAGVWWGLPGIRSRWYDRGWYAHADYTEGECRRR